MTAPTTQPESLTDIAYGPGAAHKLDLHVPVDARPQRGRPPLVCFVHGGAWRAEDKKHHAELADRIANCTGFVVAVPNYRLTPNEPAVPPDPATDVCHPAHAEDVLAALTFLHTWTASPEPYDTDAFYLIGHSCGAHILSCIFLDSSAVTPSLTPSPTLLNATKGLILSEGIYDIDRLLVSFPAYKAWFIANAFGDRTSYADVSSTQYGLRADGSHIGWSIIHSRADTLVDLEQSQGIYDHLRAAYQVSGREDAVQKIWDTIDLEHNEMLKTEAYSDLVGRIIQRAYTESTGN